MKHTKESIVVFLFVLAIIVSLQVGWMLASVNAVAQGPQVLDKWQLPDNLGMMYVTADPLGQIVCVHWLPPSSNRAAMSCFKASDTVYGKEIRDEG